MNRIMNHLLLVIAAVLILSPPLHAAPKTEILTLGVFPYLSANQMMEQLSPLCKRIEAALFKNRRMTTIW